MGSGSKSATEPEPSVIRTRRTDDFQFKVRRSHAVWRLKKRLNCAAHSGKGGGKLVDLDNMLIAGLVADCHNFKVVAVFWSLADFDIVADDIRQGALCINLPKKVLINLIGC